MKKNERIERIKYFILAKFRNYFRGKRKYLLLFLLLIPIFFFALNLLALVNVTNNEFISEGVKIRLPYHIVNNEYLSNSINSNFFSGQNNALQSYFGFSSAILFYAFPLIFGIGAMIFLRKYVSGFLGFMIGFGIGLTIGVFVNLVSPYILISYLIVLLIYFAYKYRVMEL